MASICRLTSAMRYQMLPRQREVWHNQIEHEVFVGRQGIDAGNGDSVPEGAVASPTIPTWERIWSAAFPNCSIRAALLAALATSMIPS